jgi:hypothetical protein
MLSVWSYDAICMAAFAELWWFMVISCDIQILLVVGSTRGCRITNSAPNGPAKRWSFWGVNKFDWCPQCVAWYSYADTVYSHARRVDQTPRAPMDTDWLHPRLGKRKNEDEEVPHASQFSILSWTRIYWTPDHRELCLPLPGPQGALPHDHYGCGWRRSSRGCILQLSHLDFHPQRLHIVAVAVFKAPCRRISTSIFSSKPNNDAATQSDIRVFSYQCLIPLSVCI